MSPTDPTRKSQTYRRSFPCLNTQHKVDSKFVLLSIFLEESHSNFKLKFAHISFRFGTGALRTEALGPLGHCSTVAQGHCGTGDYGTADWGLRYWGLQHWGTAALGTAVLRHWGHWATGALRLWATGALRHWGSGDCCTVALDAVGHCGTEALGHCCSVGCGTAATGALRH